MFQLDSFIIQGHQKIIDHYRWLRDTAVSEAERERFERRMIEEYDALKRYSDLQSSGARHAA